ncbi:Protein kinase domain-containing protein [Fusarium falciforme]|uniref:Protein kinase domain-containing protein n=1 Tax=Fusarium falciforme TaxID=195108 RepID=UPI002301EF0F|nr:Protein kinase domain-containing protein [Fusarium falciforme]WAO90292.1 Protein kinase domain-containing protein [Fusarium falciforme]
MTGLHLASAFGLVNVVSRMIGSGKFSLRLRTDDGWTALHWAVEKGREDVAAFLLTLPDKESFISCKTNSEGCTALHIAVKHLRAAMVKVILKAKADANAQDSRGRTPLYLAVWSVQEDFVEKLLSSGADPNIPSIYGTALHCAVRRGAPSLVLVRALISASGSRIDLDTKDVLALTPLEEAQARGRDDVAAILLEAGAKPSLDLILTQAYILGSHQGLSSKESWQAYENDLVLSCQIKQGNQCTCHVLKSQKQKLGHAEGQVMLEHKFEGDAAPPTRVFRKTFDLASDVQGQVQKYLLSEWQILFKLRHPHIVRYIDSDEDPYHNEFLLYMEFCDKGDVESFHGIQLRDLTARENKRYGFVEDETRLNLRPLSGVEIWAMIWQMASALAYLHYGLSIRRKNGLYAASLEGQWAYIIHRDVKPANIVMHGAEKDKFLFKLCDLGIASHAGLGPDQNQTQLIGSSGLQPPEVRQGELWTTRGDMFSLGETIRLTAKAKDELLNCQAFKSFLDGARGIDEDSRPTSLEAMEIAYGNLRKAPGSFSELPRAVVEEMRSVHQVLGRWGGSYLLQSFLLTAELLDSSQPFQQGLPTDDRKNLVKRLWLLLDDGAAETFTGRYELPAHLLILLEGRSAEEKQSRELDLDRVLKTSANVNHQWVKSGWSALHIAAQERNLSALKTLLRYEAEVDLEDKHGMTAKDYAKENGFGEMLVLLEQTEKAVVEQHGEVRGNTRKRMRLV